MERVLVEFDEKRGRPFGETVAAVVMATELLVWERV